MACAVTTPACHSFNDGLAACLSTVQNYALKEVTRLEALVDELRAENRHLAQQLNRFNPHAEAFEDTKAEVAEGHLRGGMTSVVPPAGAAKPIEEVEAWGTGESKRRGQLKSLPSSVSQQSEAIKAEVKANKRSAKPATQPFHDQGWAQQIAKSHWFEVASLGVILFNSIWISIDLDYNAADSMLTADPVFVVMDNFFCIFFTLELVVRFAALKFKSNCLSDPWFVFDTILVLAMIVETWIVTLVLLTTGTNSIQGMSSMSVLRMLRLLRLTRMARMMSAFPEVMILVTGLKNSVRSVMVTMAMLLAITYVFAIVLKQLTVNSNTGEEFYNSVPLAMKTLLYETVVPDNAGMLDDLGEQGWYLPIIFAMFICLSALTFLNMLVGFLCDVVSTVSAEEKEAAEIERMTEKLRDIISELDTDYDGLVSSAEISNLLSNKTAIESLDRVGVDVIALVQELDFIVDSEGLAFEDFVEVVLQFRTTQAATIGVIAGLRKAIHRSFCDLEERIKELQRKDVGAKVSV